jgi:tetratricopeptide (TPR) repeat protein
MRNATIIGCLGLLIVGPAVFAQQGTPPPATAGQAQPPSVVDVLLRPTAQTPAQSAAQAQAAAAQKVYQDALKLKDPQEKITALNKAADGMGVAMYSIAVMARSNALDTLAKHFPDRKDEIRAQAELILRIRSSSSMHFLIAKTLLERGVMLDYAEETARKALALFERETAATTAADRARFKAVLGLVYAKNGKFADADALLRDVVAIDAMPADDAPTGMAKMLDDAIGTWNKGQRQAAVALALAETAEKKGDLKTAVSALGDASMLAPMKAADRKRLEDLYRKTHNGSLDGLEDELDAKYRTLNPAPFAAVAYKPGAERTTRTVLAEMFTGSACGPCVAADLGFDALLRRYGRQELALLVYHLHVPAPDPMTNPSTNARAKAYGINSTPSYFIDGGDKLSGGGDRSGARTFYQGNSTVIDKRLSIPVEGTVALKASMTDGVITASVNVDPVKSGSADLRLHIALVENELSYTGENGVRFHPMVVRQLAGQDHNGFAVTAGKPLSIDHRFDVAAVSRELQAYIDDFVKNPPARYAGDDISFSRPMHALDANKLSVVAFVQDDKTRQILQSSYVSVKPASAAAAAPKKEQ